MPNAILRITVRDVIAMLCCGALAAATALADPIEFDVNGDGFPEIIEVLSPVEPETSTNAMVRVLDESAVLIHELPPISGPAWGIPGPFARFGFQVRPGLNVRGDVARVLLVTAPRHQEAGGGEGAVLVYAAANGQPLAKLTAPTGVRLGLDVAVLADQDGDDHADLLVAGARQLSDARWEPETFLFSAVTGRLIARRDQSIPFLLNYAANGGTVYQAGDLDDSGLVDIGDVTLLAALIGATAAELPAGDLDHDGTISIADLQILLNFYLSGRRSIASAVNTESETSEVWTEFSESWDAAYTGELTVGPGSGSNLTGVINPNTTWISCDPIVTESGCFADLGTCQRFLELGQSFHLNYTSTEGTCVFSLVGEPGVLTQSSLSPDTFVATGVGLVAVHVECTCGGVTSCRECVVFVARPMPPPPPCEPTVELLCCNPSAPADVTSGALYRIEARGQPLRGEYRWSIHTDTPGTVNGARTWLADWPTMRLATGEVTGNVTITVEYVVPNCPTVTASCVLRVVADADHDGLSDDAETTLGTLSDNPDTDGDGWRDGCEVSLGSSPTASTSIPVQAAMDSDRDGLSDAEEFCIYASDPYGPDTDGDGVHDLAEARLGLSIASPPAPSIRENLDLLKFNNWTCQVGLVASFLDTVTLPVSTDDRMSEVFRAADADHDLVLDSYERQIGSDPKNADSDHDGIIDGVELLAGRNPQSMDTEPLSDLDLDGLGDLVELYIYNSNPRQDDSDYDGLTDGWEVQFGLNPNKVDSDENGIPDGQEDADQDGLTNLQEHLANSNPRATDTDGDGVDDGHEVAVGTDPTNPVDAGRRDPTRLMAVTVHFIGQAVNRSVLSWTINIGATQLQVTEPINCNTQGTNVTFSKQIYLPKAIYMPVRVSPSFGNSCSTNDRYSYHLSIIPVDLRDAENDWIRYWKTGAPTCQSWSFAGVPGKDYPTRSGIIIPNIRVRIIDEQASQTAARVELDVEPASVASEIGEIQWYYYRQDSYQRDVIPAGDAAVSPDQRSLVFASPGNSLFQKGGVEAVVAFSGNLNSIVPGTNGNRACDLFSWHAPGGILSHAKALGRTPVGGVRTNLVIDSLNEWDSKSTRMPPYLDTEYCEDRHPGRFIMTTCGLAKPNPSYFDLPGFAMGYGHSWDPSDHVARYRTLRGRDFAPMYLHYPLAARVAGGSVKFKYSASDPGAISRASDSSESGGYAYTLPPGRLRVWHGNFTHADNDYHSVLEGGDGAYIPPDVSIPLALLDPEGLGMIQLSVEAVRPSEYVGGDSIQVEVSPHQPGDTWSDTVVVTAVRFSLHDLRHWKPYRVNPSSVSNSFDIMRFTHTDPYWKPEPSSGIDTEVDGAITDGASPLLLRPDPPLRGYAKIKAHIRLGLPLNTPHTEQLGWLQAVPDSGWTVPLLPLDASEEQASSIGMRYNEYVATTSGCFVYVPPNNFSPYTGPWYQGLIFKNDQEQQFIQIDVVEMSLLDGAPRESFWDRNSYDGVVVSLRRPPLVIVHGLYGSGTGYWGRDDFSEPDDRPVPTRMYYADYENTAVRGFDVNWPEVPKTIAKAMADYRNGNDDIGPHAPWNEGGGTQHVEAKRFWGLRHAATRADVVAHSMGGNITRLYVSGVDGVNVPRRDGWPRNIQVSRGDPVTDPEATETYHWRYLREDNFGAGDIRRLITIGTPFDGSPGAYLSEMKHRPAGSKLIYKTIQMFSNIERIDKEETDRSNYGSSGGAPEAQPDLEKDSAMHRLLENRSVDGQVVVPANYPTGRRAVRWHPIGTLVHPFDLPNKFAPQDLQELQHSGALFGGLKSFMCDGIVQIESATNGIMTRPDTVESDDRKWHNFVVKPTDGRAWEIYTYRAKDEFHPGDIWQPLPDWARATLILGHGHSPHTPGQPVPHQMNSAVISDRLKILINGHEDLYNVEGLDK